MLTFSRLQPSELGTGLCLECGAWLPGSQVLLTSIVREVRSLAGVPFPGLPAQISPPQGSSWDAGHLPSTPGPIQESPGTSRAPV